ncbi:MAG TPA: PilC/PilY family type IV pilus protein [Burkholderiales bacterium]|nr:PilC/PilY family type IV pilus protein [Burkholderiales bacterium]
MRELSTRTQAAIAVAASALIGSTTAFVAGAATTDISSVPLASGSSVVVKPNLLLTMDTSGSMAWDFMPDNVDPGTSSDDGEDSSTSYTCRTNSSSNNECLAGDPPYYAYQYNFVAYNPTFTYLPGVDYQGNSLGTMGSPWTSVAVNKYTSASTIQLAAITGPPAKNGQFPEQVYLNGNSVTSGSTTYPIYKRNGELYCPDITSTTTPCFPGNLPPTENGVTAPAFSYNTPKGPSLTGVVLSGFGSGTIVTGKLTNHGLSQGDIIDVVCTSGTGATTPYRLVNTVPVIQVVDANNFTFYAGQSFSGLTCTQATVNPSVVGLPDQSSVAFTAPAAALSLSGSTVTVTFFNHMLMVGDLITVKTTDSGNKCVANNVTVTSATQSATSPYVGTPYQFKYTTSASGTCKGAYTFTRQPYNAVASAQTTPFYYRMTPTEYCADQHLSVCYASKAALANYTFPATVRYCNSAAAAAAAPVAPPSASPPAPSSFPANPACQNKFYFAGGYIYPRYGQFTRTDVVPGNNAYNLSGSPYPNRTDCSGAACTYAQEMTNFSNWYAYYRTRIQMMKTIIGQAFLNITSNYRVGFVTINPGSNTGNVVSSSNKVSTTHFVPVSDFVGGSTSSQRGTFYSTLYSQVPGQSTPLRSALARAGRYFGGKNDGINAGMVPNQASDPVQYSCQQNFTLLTTDGYWNTNANGDTEAVGMDGSTVVGDQDSNASTQTQGIYEGPNCPAGNYNNGGCTNTLADVAAYYYNTDLRSSTWSNTTGALNTDVSPNNVPTTPTDPQNQQHMTTFTLGLADGLLTWQSNYATATTGDYASITSSPAATGCWWPPVNGGSGACQWPIPKHDTPTALDDLWHAAVNGHGTYYHGTNPRSVASGIANALSSINTRLAAAAASSTSSPNITQQNDLIYSSTYDTMVWSGDLIAQTVNLDGTVNKTPLWDAATTLDAAPWTGRTINSLNLVTKKLMPFTWAGITATGQQSIFQNVCTPTALLSQCITLSPSQITTINDGSDLVNFLVGDRSNENTTSTPGVFRQRSRVLGDTVDAQPAYVAAPTFAFADAVSPTYGTFQAANALRQPVLYIGANDGMLHAFDAQVGTGHNGAELWAYVPRVLWSKLYMLADFNYGNLHQFYVDGSPQIMDVYFQSDGAWHTVLVGGLNDGGRGYYALDITNPTAPVALWEFCSDATVCTVSDPNVGLTYGNAVITKRVYDGKWVVLVTSGYNNVPTVSAQGTPTTGGVGSGAEWLYVLDVATGAILDKVSTGVGTITSPGGLARIAAWADNFNIDNTTKYVYGGDLQGNVWRFDMSTSPPAVLKLGTVADGAGNPQPVTTKPELGSINGYRVVYVGTGEYLGASDLSTTNTQSMYAFKDLGTMYGNIRSGANLVQQTISSASAGTRTSSNNSVDWSQKNGWYVDFPTGGERVNIDPSLVLGTLVVVTNIPSGTACTVGGSSWIYQFNYQTGAYVPTAQSGVVATYNSSAVTVGFVVVEVPGGGLKAIETDATATKTTQGVNVGNSPLSGKRVGWRQM